MRVEADEGRVRKRLGHDDGGVAVAAADVGDQRTGLQLRDRAVELRQPLLDQAAAIGVAVEARDAAVQAAVVVAPGNPLAAAEGLDRSEERRVGQECVRPWRYPV